jgi:ribose transport system substrate-binding protein
MIRLCLVTLRRYTADFQGGWNGRREAVNQRVLKAIVGLVLAIVVVAVGYVAVQRWTTAGGERRIAVVLASSDNPFWIDVRRGAEDAAAELAGKYKVSIAAAPGTNAQAQVDFIRNFYDRKEVDALVLGPASSSAPIGALDRYSASNIPIVVIDSELKADEIASHRITIAAFIGSNNVQGGERAAEAMASALKGPTKRVLLIKGSQVHQSALDRAAGFEEGARKAGLEVIAADGEWLFERAQQVTTARLSRGRLDGIFASNDVMALGAVAALKAMNTPRDAWPVVIGYDATKDALQAIERGEMYKSIQQDARLMGKEGVLAAVAALNKDPSLQKRRLLDVKAVP